MPRKLTKLEKFGLIAALVTGITFFYLKQVYDPQQTALIKSQEALNRTIRQFNEAQALEPIWQLEQSLAVRRESLAEREKALQELIAQWPQSETGEDPVAVRLWLYRLTTARGLRLLGVSGPQSREHLSFPRQVYRLELEGDYAGLLRLLQSLATVEPPVRVGGLAVRGEGVPWPLRIDLEIWFLTL